jgi:hypothetical protein
VQHRQANAVTLSIQQATKQAASSAQFAAAGLRFSVAKQFTPTEGRRRTHVAAVGYMPCLHKHKR